MGANVLAMTNNINDYPEEISDIVNTLIYLQDDNEAREPVNDQLRGWIDDRLTILANFSHLKPKLAERLPSKTRKQIGMLLQNPAKVLQFGPKPICA